MVYRLPAKPSKELGKNLRCLQDCVQEDKVFKQDLARLKRCRKAMAADAACGCD